MHTITDCPKCGSDFMYHQTDVHLNRVLELDPDTKKVISYEVICQDCDEKETSEEYPIQDDIWPSRRWNKNMTDYIDLSYQTLLSKKPQ